MDEVAGRKSHKSGRRPKPSGNVSLSHTAAADDHVPTYLMPYEHQAAADSFPPSLHSCSPIVTDGVVTQMPYRPITPLSDTVTPPPEFLYALNSSFGLDEYDLAQSYDVSHLQPHLSSLTPATSSPSRDTFCAPTTKDPSPHQEALLPSPPASPQHAVSKAPLDDVKLQKARSLPSRESAQTLPSRSSPDPMFQTSTDPHFWSTNCTVLKVDTCLLHGNVTSPTCMVGLPFGSMTEMIVPVSLNNSVDDFDHDEEMKD